MRKMEEHEERRSPLTIDEIQALIATLDASSVGELEYEKDGERLVLRKQPFSPQSVALPATEEGASEQEEDAADEHVIRAPMVGTFYSAPSPEAEPFVTVGSHVEEDTVVCIIEAMKLMNEIQADCRGEITAVLAENGQVVEYGQPLFRVRTS